MGKKNVHVVPHPEGWAVKSEGAGRAAHVTGTQQQAIDAARQMAKNNQSEMYIHGQNGQIREANSYGKDSCPPKG